MPTASDVSAGPHSASCIEAKKQGAGWIALRQFCKIRSAFKQGIAVAPGFPG